MIKILFFLTITITTSLSCENIFDTAKQQKHPVPDGYYMTFNGTGQYAQSAHNILLNFSTTMTLEAWVKINDLTNSQQIIGKWGPNTATAEYRLRFAPGSPNYLVFQFGNGSTTDSYSINFDTLGIGANTWFHIACVFNNGLVQVYINGSLHSSSTSSITSLSNATGTYGLHIAEVYSSNMLLNGALDEIRLWNTARSASKISTYYNNCVPSTTPGLVLYMDFNDGSGSVITDNVNSLNATTVGSPGWVSW